MLETVSAAETALYCFLLSGSIFFFAMVLLSWRIIVAKEVRCRIRLNPHSRRPVLRSLSPAFRNQLATCFRSQRPISRAEAAIAQRCDFSRRARAHDMLGEEVVCIGWLTH